MDKHTHIGLAILSLLLLPASASAATVGGQVKTQNGLDVGVITFTAARGETNQVTVSTDSKVRRVFRDAANPLQAKGDCEQVDQHTVRCAFTEDFAQVKLGDG